MGGEGRRRDKSKQRVQYVTGRKEGYQMSEVKDRRE